MTASVSLASIAAILLLATAPYAAAFTVQHSSSVPTINGARVADPDDVQQNLTDQSVNGGMTTLGTRTFGNSTLSFGVSRSGDGAFGGNNWFLEDPAARTVPSQR